MSQMRDKGEVVQSHQEHVQEIVVRCYDWENIYLFLLLPFRYPWSID